MDTGHMMQHVRHSNRPKTPVLKRKPLAVQYQTDARAGKYLGRDEVGNKLSKKTCAGTQFQHLSGDRRNALGNLPVPLHVDLLQEGFSRDDRAPNVCRGWVVEIQITGKRMSEKITQKLSHEDTASVICGTVPQSGRGGE